MYLLRFLKKGMRAFCFLGLFAFCWVNPSFAESEFTLSPKVVYYSYHEQVMDETGVLGGISGEWKCISAKSLYLGVEGEVLYGQLNYDGQYQDGTPVSLSTEDYLVQATAAVGRIFDFSFGSLTPYTGLKYHFWQDDLQGEGGYIRRISQFYLPVGVNFERMLRDGWSVRAKVEASVLLYGEVYSYLSDAAEGYPNIKNVQQIGRGMGARFAFSIRKKVGKYHFAFTPSFEWYEAQTSEKTTIELFGKRREPYEPYNNKWMLGAMLSLSF